MQSGKPELARSDLVPAHLGLLEHEPTGDFYAPSLAEQTGEQYDSFEAFIIERSGDVTFLERPASPGRRSRAELEERAQPEGGAMIDQGVARTKLENLMRDKDGQIAELALKLDLLDAAIWDERLLQYQETKARLERIGVDVSKFRPPPRPGRAEQRSAQHVDSTTTSRSSSPPPRRARSTAWPASTSPTRSPSPSLPRSCAATSRPSFESGSDRVASRLLRLRRTQGGESALGLPRYHRSGTGGRYLSASRVRSRPRRRANPHG